MDEERSQEIIIGGKKYQLLLTTKATKEIAKRYGGLDKLGESLMVSDNFEEALSEIIWLITLLANQPILINNYLNNKKEELLTEEVVELLTSPSDLSDYKDAISQALIKGTKRNIQSEATNKNPQQVE